MSLADRISTHLLIFINEDGPETFLEALQMAMEAKAIESDDNGTLLERDAYSRLAREAGIQLRAFRRYARK
jgi:hypothetical protein